MKLLFGQRNWIGQKNQKSSWYHVLNVSLLNQNCGVDCAVLYHIVARRALTSTKVKGGYISLSI